MKHESKQSCLQSQFAFAASTNLNLQKFEITLLTPTYVKINFQKGIECVLRNEISLNVQTNRMKE